jgi:hypothetical protein
MGTRRRDSAVEQLKEPSGPLDLCSQVPDSLAQRTVRRHQCHLGVRVSSDRNKGVIPAAGRMHDSHAVGCPRCYAAPSSAFENHNDRFGEPARLHRSTNSFNEHAGCPWSIPPPAVRPGPDHVCRVDEEHCLSIAVAW